MSFVEQSIQLQIQDIAAVKQAFSVSLAKRSPETLWWLVDHSEDIVYENRVKGSSILAIDKSVDNVNIASLYSDWFNLQNAYFSQDQPITTPTGVTTLKTAIELYYRWRVSQYFNDIMSAGSGQGISPPYVFPYPDSDLFSYDGTAWKKGTAVDLTVTGPGILGVIPIGAATAALDTLSITAVYPDPPGLPVSTVVFPAVSVPAASPVGVAVPVGGQKLIADYILTDGVVAVGSTALGFKVGYPVVISENTPGSDLVLPVIKFEVAEVSAMTGTSLTLRMPTPPGATASFLNGLKNQYTMAAFVYPLFKDVTVVTGGSTDKLQIGFYPDYPQGFVDVASIVVPQVAGQSRSIDSESPSSPPPPPLPPSPSSPPPPPLPPSPPSLPPPPASRSSSHSKPITNLPS